MDIKKRIDFAPKKLERTVRTFSRSLKAVNKAQRSSRSGANANKNTGRQMPNSENEGVYASDKTMQTAKEARKRAIKAPYHALKREMHRRRKNDVRFRQARGQTPSSSLQRTGSGQKDASFIKTRVYTDGRKQLPASLSKQTIHAKKMNAFRKNAVKKHIERTRKAVLTIKQGVLAIIHGAMSFFRTAKTIWFLIAAGAGNVVIVACIVAIVAAILSPFAFLFGGINRVDQYPSLAEVANDINAEYTAKFKKIIDDHDYVDGIEIKDFEIDSSNYVAINWKDILSVWSINNDIYRGGIKTDEELDDIDPEKSVEQEELPYVMTGKNIVSLTNMFWQMNEITYKVKTEVIEVEPSETPSASAASTSESPEPEPTPETITVKTLIVTPVSKDYLWGADHYEFDEDQRSWLEELMDDRYQKEWSLLLMGIVGTEMTEAQNQLLASLPAGPGAAIALNASSRLGHPYSRQKRGQGLYVDCSYLARWCYHEAGYTWFTPATAAEQARWCHNNGYMVERSQIKAGDLLFYSFAQNGRYKNISHVAVYIGRASDGKEYMIDASASNGFVIYREVFSDTHLVMCGRPLMHLD